MEVLLKTVLAAALAAGVLVAAPFVVGFAQNPSSDPPPAAASGDGGGPAGGGPMWKRHAMMHGRWMHGDPQERCIDRLAWRAARRTYVETKLDLTAEQRPLWDKVASAAQTEEQKERQLCASLKAGAAPSIVDRLNRMQQFLTARLDGLNAAKPAVEALYQALTPAQRAILNQPFHHHRA
jgi:hypothetical protein